MNYLINPHSLFLIVQVMDNLLAQVTGMKRVVLYSPQDALHLYLSGQWLFYSSCSY